MTQSSGKSSGRDLATTTTGAGQPVYRTDAVAGLGDHLDVGSLGPAEEQVRVMSTGMRERGHSVRLVAHGRQSAGRTI